MEFKKLSNYDINITHTANGGAILRIGCAEFGFSDHLDMLNALKDYYDNPEEMEKQYNETVQKYFVQPVPTEPGYHDGNVRIPGAPLQPHHGDPGQGNTVMAAGASGAGPVRPRR